MHFKSLLSWLLILLSIHVSGQFKSQPNKNQYFSNFKKEKHIVKKKQPGHLYNTLVTKNGEIKINDLDLSEEQEVIVEFKEKPLFIKKKENKLSKPNAAFYLVQFAGFKNDIYNIHQRLSKKLRIDLKLPEIKKEYFKLYNGVSLRATRAIVQSLQSLGYVKKVYPDNQVSAYLHESVPLIKADSVWYQVHSQGDSIVIGILDTGIDYLHPALGGGFGKGYKVIGGYDLYNNDNDPMDDNGHGTHVAGIAAADCDSLKGVAPKALLMAFKVLDQGGYGEESTIIEGIERTADPNNNGDYEDKVDIVNMSLGGSGNADDPMSTAVDNAVKLGIIYCIAAGNNGSANAPSTLGSPGTSRLAITVGASTKEDKLAYFSSAGPNGNICTIKPEIIAPGYEILSSVPGGKYESYSGTSMAAPHIAGVCALLKRLHPDWSPEEIKSAVMTTAIDLGNEVMVQGAGRVDALSAAKVSTLACPSHLSFGLDDSRLTLWHVGDTLYVKNKFNTTQDYEIHSIVNTPGVELFANPSIFSVSAGDSQKVVFSLTVDNGIVPFPNKNYLTYSGTVFIDGSKDKLHLPWAFVKALRLNVKFDKPSPFFIISSANYLVEDSQADWSDDYYSLNFIIPQGEYDVLTKFWDATSSVVIKENIILNQFDSITVNSTEAKFLLTCVAKDKYGQDFPSTNRTSIDYTIKFPDSSLMQSVTFGGEVVNLLTSSVSGRFNLFANGLSYSENGSAWLLDYNQLQGIDRSSQIVNNYSNFSEQVINISAPPLLNSSFISLARWTLFFDDTNVFGIGFSEGNFSCTNNFWSSKLNIVIPKDIHKNVVNAIGYALYGGNEFNMENIFYTPPFGVYNNKIGIFFSREPSQNIYLADAGSSFSFKNWLIYSDGFHLNNHYGKSNIYVAPSFYGQIDEMREVEYETSVCRIFNEDNNLIKEDTLKNIGPYNVIPGKYRTEVTASDYYIEGHQGEEKLVCKYDLRLADPNPPVINSVQIRNSQGIPESRLERGEKAALLISAKDMEIIKLSSTAYHVKYNPVMDDSTCLYIKQHDTGIWNKLNVIKLSEDTLIGCFYTVDLSNYTKYDSTALDLKISVYDFAGNSTEMIIEPAVAVGKYKEITGYPGRDIAAGIPKEYKLYNNYPNPFNPITKISFAIPENAKVKIQIFNLVGQEVAVIADETKLPGTYIVNWDADRLASGIYFCKIRAEGKKIFEKTQKLVLMK